MFKMHDTSPYCSRNLSIKSYKVSEMLLLHFILLWSRPPPGVQRKFWTTHLRSNVTFISYFFEETGAVNICIQYYSSINLKKFYKKLIKFSHIIQVQIGCQCQADSLANVNVLVYVRVTVHRTCRGFCSKSNNALYF